MLNYRIQQLRVAKGLTQRQLAELVNVSQQSIDHYEKGRAKPPVDTLILLAKLFNVTTDYLLGLSEHDFLFDQRLNFLFSYSLKNANYKLSIEQFASMCGASIDQVQSWMAGKSAPDIDTLKKLATTFSVTANWLAGKTDILYIGKKLRHKEALSIDDLSILTGVDPCVITKYEFGEIDNFNPEALARICYYFDCTPNYLLGFDNFYRGEYLCHGATEIESAYIPKLVKNITESIASISENEMKIRKYFFKNNLHLRSFIGEKLKKIREDRNISHNDIIKKLMHGAFPLLITAEKLIAYEKGTETMDIYTLTAFCAVFEVSPVHFIGLDGQVKA